MAKIMQVILKGRLVGQVETRNMFVWGCAADADDSVFCINVATKLEAMLEQVTPFIAFPGWESYAYEVNKWSGEAWVPIYETQWEVEGLATTEDLVSFQASMLLRMATSAFKVAGRKFLPGFCENATVLGGFTENAVVAGALYILEWLTPMPSGVYDSWYAGVMDKNNVFRAFIGGTVGSIISGIRRRKPGYGI